MSETSQHHRATTPSSLPPYADNNAVNDGRIMAAAAAAALRSSSNAAHGAGGGAGGSSSSRRRALKLNGLWSVWYGLLGTLLQAYAAMLCAKRYVRYALLPWPTEEPVLELQVALFATGLAVLMLPLFLASAMFKVGNHANDGVKLGAGTKTTSVTGSPLLPDRTSVPAAPASGNGACGGLWRHAGPTAPLLHLMIAACLLVPKLVMEARLIQAGYLPQDAVWRTDLDFMLVHHDRLVVLSFMAAGGGGAGPASIMSNSSGGEPPAPLPLMHGGPPATVNATSAIPRDLVQALQELLGIDATDATVDAGWGGSISAEYLNYATALLAYSVRYPAVFWATNKCFAAVFSVQLLANALQSLVGYAAVSVLYKVQILGARRCLPLLSSSSTATTSLVGSSTGPFLLDAHTTLVLHTLDGVLVLASGLALQLYGRGRMAAFVARARDRRSVTAGRSAPEGGGSGYRPHCAALLALVGVAVTGAPLLHDLAVAYSGSLDGACLAGVVTRVAHLFGWVVVWLGLTLKTHWTFHLRMTIASVRLHHSHIHLLSEIDFHTSGAGGSNRSSTGSTRKSRAPLLVVGGGRAYPVQGHAPQKAIMAVVQKEAVAMRESSGGGSAHSAVGSVSSDAEEQVYWLRPAPGSGDSSPGSAAGAGCFWGRRTHPHQRNGGRGIGTRDGGGSATNAKVSFDEATSTSARRLKAHNAKSRAGGTGGGLGGARSADDDDGDYATLRELPAAMLVDDNISEEGKLLERLRDDRVTYASGGVEQLVPPIDDPNQDSDSSSLARRVLLPQRDDYEDPSPLLTPDLDAVEMRDERNQQRAAVRVSVYGDHHQQLMVGSPGPRCLRRTDSGMPPEELTPRSDSLTTGSPSPPGPPASNHSSETSSSGVHSSASSEQHHQNAAAGSNGRSQPVAVVTAHRPGLLRQSEASTAHDGYVRGVPVNATALNTSSGVVIVTQKPSDGNAARSVVEGLYGYVNKPDKADGLYGYGSRAGSVTSGTDGVYGYAGTAKTVDGPYGYAKSPQRMNVSNDGYGYCRGAQQALPPPPPEPVEDPYGWNGGYVCEEAVEAAVVVKPQHQEVVVAPAVEEPFGRSTNMKMVSFTERSAAATLPHFPTQPTGARVAGGAQCSTMPLPPAHGNPPAMPASMHAQQNNSCGGFPRQHTTLPTHHNGVRLFAHPNARRQPQPPNLYHKIYNS